MTMSDSDWQSRAVSAEEAVKLIPSGAKVFVHGAAATPTPLVEAMCALEELEGVELYHLHLSGPTPFSDPELTPRFTSISFFSGPAQREAINDGRADFVPVFLSEIPRLFTSRAVPLDVALIQVSRPDKHGHCTLGTSIDCARAAFDSARIRIVEVNERMPRTHGHTMVRLRDFDAFIHSDRPIHAHEPARQTAVTRRIGELVAELVDDGSTLQMGIGAIPDAALSRMGNKIDLGVHTEMFSDGLLDLLEGGVITNRYKKVHAGRTTSSFLAGTQRLYDFVDDNAQIELHPCDRTNDVALIRSNPKVVAINSALQVDLSGQVCADSLGFRIYSGIGGQMDFMAGASWSPGGQPIIALPATASRGQISRITMALSPGAGVVTTRGHVQWVVTEYGAVNLHGLSLHKRADALISIAHPDFRRQLRKEYKQIRRFRLAGAPPTVPFMPVVDADGNPLEEK